jgi:hypothetical protein
MNIDTRQLIEIVGVTAVVVSLLLVALELSQTNSIAIASMEYELRDNYSSINELVLSDRDVAELLNKAKDPAYQVSDIERVQAYEYVARYSNVWAAVESAYDQGMLTEESYTELLDEAIRFSVFQYPALHDLWREELENYSSQIESDRQIALRRYMDEYSGAYR